MSGPAKSVVGRQLKPGDPVPAGLPERQAWLGQHFCHFHYGLEHFAVNAGSFLAAGLLNGEMCAAYATAEGRALVERFLARRNFSASQAEQAGQLLWLARDEVLRAYAPATAEAVLSFYGSLCDRARSEGRGCLRIVGQSDVVVEALGWQRLFVLERAVTEVVRGLPMVVLCEYRFVPDSTEQAELAAIHPYYHLSAMNWVETAEVSACRGVEETHHPSEDETAPTAAGTG